MKFDIGAIFEQVLGFYLRLPLAQKIALPLLAAGCMALIMFVSNWATRSEYAVLYSNLSDADASGVVERLKDRKIGYRLTNDGKTVEITPPSIVHEVRLELASAGLPKGDQVGFELWNETKLGQSAFGEWVNFGRTVQGELERTILKIEGIGAVRVHVTNPKRSVFASRDVPPTASVLLKLKAGHELTIAQTKGIAHLVAGSIERLTPENVTILDQMGKILNEKVDSSSVNGADLTHLQFQREIENAYSKRIETMLTEILGAGRAVARVTAMVDFSRLEKEEESFDPAGTVTRSEREIQENQGTSSDGGVPGVLSNLTNQPGVLSQGANGSNLRRESVKNYEVSRAVSKITKNPGKIERLSVAVLVDGQYADVPTGAQNPDGAPVMEKRYMPLSPDMVKKVDGLVKQTVGFDAARGDTVTIENIKFIEPDSSLLEVLEKTEMSQNLMGLTEWIPAVLLFVFTLFIVIKPMVSFLLTPTDAEVDLSRLLPAGIEELEAELEAERAKLSSIPDKRQPAIDIEELETLLSENSRMVKDNPQQAALLIRYWLNDGRI
ncbi:MAG TPA: flagellar basal-body MS-ring/collar protein FliF [Oligoflexia bacterium]|nr:flagellar basal-body MS-ring/collar protein FliF [Oligoflexia bacterium]HMP47582.1 flagellar basal-body MS-ring/collar protein FliF [Oligoflexia bacterium]